MQQAGKPASDSLTADTSRRLVPRDQRDWRSDRALGLYKGDTTVYQLVLASNDE